MENEAYVQQEPNQYARIKAAVAYIQPRLGKASIGVILGTGLNHLVEILEDRKSVSFDEIPFMPITTVTGHAGKFVSGVVGGKNVFCLMGRVHGYEGHQAAALTFATRILVELGMKVLITTNAAGGAILDMPPGCLMLIHSHINFTRRDPLRDSFHDSRLGARTVDTSKCYSERICKIAHEVAEQKGLRIFDGTYCWTTGPTYETSNEVSAAMKMGGHAFGMSTVPEVIAASSLGVEVLAISMVTNLATGLSPTLLSHEEVKAMGVEHGAKIESFVVGILTALKEEEIVFNPHPSVKSNLFVPKDPTKQPTEENIHEAAKFLESLIPKGGKILVASIDEATFNIVDKLSKVNQIEIKDIPHMPISSASAYHGRLFIGQVSGSDNIVVVLETVHDEGFSHNESFFLSNIFSDIGASSFVLTGSAGTLGKSKVGDVVVVGDIFNWTCSTNLVDVSSSAFSGKVHSAAVSKVGEPNSYFWLPGPSMESRGEIQAAKTFGLDLIGTSSLTLLYAFAGKNIQTTFLATVTHECGNPSSNVRSNTSDIALELFKTELPEKSSSTANYKPTIVCVPSKSAQDAHKEISNAQNHLKQWLAQSTPSFTVFFYGWENLVQLESTNIRTILFRDVEGMHGEGAFHLTEKDGRAVLWVESHASLSRGSSVSDIAFPVRVLRHVGIHKVLFATKAVSADNQAKSKFGYLADHINFTGFHSLCGHNVDEWGTRFPDMTHPYNESIWNVLVEQASSHSVVLEKSVSFLNSEATLSGAVKRGASNVGGNVITSTVVQEDIAARHMLLETSAFIFILNDVHEAPSAQDLATFNQILNDTASRA